MMKDESITDTDNDEPRFRAHQHQNGQKPRTS